MMKKIALICGILFFRRPPASAGRCFPSRQVLWQGARGETCVADDPGRKDPAESRLQTQIRGLLLKIVPRVGAEGEEGNAVGIP